MLILSIDTATSQASVALVEDAKLVCEEVASPAAGSGAAPRRGNHAQSLLPLIDKLLARRGAPLSALSAFAVTIGPGSFTGLRVGLSTVKGLAYGSETPIVGVSTLEAVAARVNDREGFIAPFLDARKKEVYGALFYRRGETLERVSDDRVMRPEAFIDSVGRRAAGAPCVFVGDAVLAYENLVKAELGAKGLLTHGDGYASTAAAAARLALDKIRRREYDPIGPLAPVYLRPSEAELKKP